MRKFIIVFLLTSISFFSSGCATSLTLVDSDYLRESHLVYSGIRLDGETFITPFYQHGQRQHWVWPILSFVDMPFSLVADTVVLPYTLWTYCHEHDQYH